MRYKLVDIGDVPSVSCPCGETRRAFIDEAEKAASLHVVTTSGESRTHYHKRLTELYYILEGEGHIELDGERFAIRAGGAVLIKPLCRHRIVGTMRFINVPVPAFDPEDEWFD